MKSMLDYYKKIQDYREVEILMAAIRLKVFSSLSNFKTHKELANELGYNETNLGVFLNSLAAIGLLEYKDGFYRNTESTDKLLNSNNVNYIGESLLFKMEMVSFDDLEERVKNGPLPNFSEKKDGSKLYDFYRLAEVSRKEMYLGRVQNILELTASLFSKDDSFRVLDLGGGSGTLAFEIAKAYPNSEVVVFEHPKVSGLPKSLIKEEGLEGRASVIEGDFNKDSIGNQYDLVIAAGVLDFAQNYIDKVSTKLYNSINNGGYLFVITHGVSEDYLSPKESIVAWLSGRLNDAEILKDEKSIVNSLVTKGFNKLKRSDRLFVKKLKSHLFRK